MKEPIILYDNDCPMCQWYTAGFVSVGVLPPEGRQAFTDLPPTLAHQIDTERARHEIALTDQATGETLYGIDSMFALFGKWQPWTQPILSWAPFRSLMKGVYSFISYNRRILAGNKGEAPAGSCAPDFHKGWRAALILFGFTLLAGISLLSAEAFSGNALNGLWVLLGWLPLLLLSPIAEKGERAWNWAGHLATLMTIQAAVLLFALPLSAIPALAQEFSLLGFAGLSALFLAFPFAKRRFKSGLPRIWDACYAVSHAVGLFLLYL